MKEFSGVLLKPVDQQGDRDGTLIDPAGVSFDPDEWVPIWRGFSYAIEDWLGRGKISRAEDGTLVVTGELVDSAPLDPKKEMPWRLAIGVIADKVDHEPGAVLRDSRLMSIAFTTNHSDPTQPPIVVGATIKKGTTMNLTRLGHYHTPGGAGEQGTCRTALVVHVVENDPIRSIVNLVVWQQDGDSEEHLGVPQDDPMKGTERGEATFHLSTECPYGK